MKIKDVIAQLEKMDQESDLKIYDYSDGRYYSNLKPSVSDNCLNFYKGI